MTLVDKVKIFEVDELLGFAPESVWCIIGDRVICLMYYSTNSCDGQKYSVSKCGIKVPVVENNKTGKTYFTIESTVSS